MFAYQLSGQPSRIINQIRKRAEASTVQQQILVFYY